MKEFLTYDMKNINRISNFPINVMTREHFNFGVQCEKAVSSL